MYFGLFLHLREFHLHERLLLYALILFLQCYIFKGNELKVNFCEKSNMHNLCLFWNYIWRENLFAWQMHKFNLVNALDGYTIIRCAREGRQTKTTISRVF